MKFNRPKLKRPQRKRTYEDILHYQKIIYALPKQMLMKKIDDICFKTLPGKENLGVRTGKVLNFAEVEEVKKVQTLRS